MPSYLAYLLSVVTPVMVVLYLRQLKTQNANSIDVAWTMLTALSGIFLAIYTQRAEAKIWWASVVLLLWGLRLSVHLVLRMGWGAKSAPEDARYANVRERIGTKAFWKVYAFQGVMIGVLALGIHAAIKNIAIVEWTQIFAATLWALLCVVGESIADSQLKQFKAKSTNKGKLCNVGLWGYSRHPNYFFEWLFWFWLPILSFGTEGFYPSFLPLALMFVFLNYFTGVKITEVYMRKKYGQDFEDYEKSTNAFFIFFKKTKQGSV